MTPTTIAFYATAATVIPVLFLALAVQGRGYENLMKTFNAMDQRSNRDIPRGQTAAAAAVAVALVAIAPVILVLAVLSEILAVYALYQQQAVSTTSQTVLIGVIVLVIATAASPALALIRAFLTPVLEDTPVLDNQAPPQYRAGTSRDDNAPPEPGKTDPV
jgi:hypothetical protein